MRKKCFKKAVSLVLCIVMSVTMTGTPVLADTFTDGSQLIVSKMQEKRLRHLQYPMQKTKV